MPESGNARLKIGTLTLSMHGPITLKLRIQALFCMFYPMNMQLVGNSNILKNLGFTIASNLNYGIFHYGIIGMVY